MQTDNLRMEMDNRSKIFESEDTTVAVSKRTILKLPNRIRSKKDIPQAALRKRKTIHSENANRYALQNSNSKNRERIWADFRQFSDRDWSYLLLHYIMHSFPAPE